MNEHESPGESAGQFHPAIDPELLSAPETMSLEQLAAQIDDLKARLPNAPKALKDLVSDEAFFNLLEEYQDEDNDTPLNDLISRYVGSHFPGRAAEIRSLFEDSDRMHRERIELEKLAAPAAKAAIIQQLSDMADTTDWDRAVGDDLDIDQALEIPFLYQEGVPKWNDYDQSMHTLKLLREDAARYALKGPTQTPESVEAPKQIEPHEWLASTNRAMRMLSRHRQNEVLNRMANVKLIGGLVDPQRPPAYPLPAGLQAALVRKFAAAASEFDATDEAAIQSHHTEDLSRALFVQGAPHLGERIGLANPTSWVQERLDKLPRIWTSGIGFIEFKEDLGTFVVGESQFERGGEHVADDNYIAVKTYDDDYDPKTNKRLVAGVLYHEVAHRAHRKRLPIAALRRWIETTDNERVNLTPYMATYRNDPDQVASGQADAEDFADSAALFMANPGEVAVNSARRFEYFNDLTRRYPLPMPIRQLSRSHGDHPRTITVQLLGRAGDPEMIPRLGG